MPEAFIKTGDDILEVFPNFFVVGATKAGTTSLYNYLKQHPEIYMSPEKETDFFSEAGTKWKLERTGICISSEAQYRALFAGVKDHKAVGEVSPSYLWDAETPVRIKRAVPDARIVISLRNPISRAFSHYLMDVRDRGQKLNFLQALKQDHYRTDKGWGVSHLYVELGLYYDQIENYFKVFGREHVLVIFFDDLAHNPRVELQKIFRFLGLSGEDASGIDVSTRHNEFAMPRNKLARYLIANSFLRKLGRRFVPPSVRGYVRNHILLKTTEKPEIDSDSRMFLEKIYRAEVEKLSKLLDTPGLCDRWGLGRVS